MQLTNYSHLNSKLLTLLLPLIVFLSLSPLIDLVVGAFGADKAVLYRYRVLMLHFELTHAFG